MLILQVIVNVCNISVNIIFECFPLFQIEMKDIEFSPRLRDACHEDAQKLCKDAQSKYAFSFLQTN